jgi:hypothetical protein
MKEVPPEAWIIRPADTTKAFSQQDQSHLNLKVHRETKK